MYMDMHTYICVYAEVHACQARLEELEREEDERAELALLERGADMDEDELDAELAQRLPIMLSTKGEIEMERAEDKARTRAEDARGKGARSRGGALACARISLSCSRRNVRWRACAHTHAHSVPPT